VNLANIPKLEEEIDNKTLHDELVAMADQDKIIKVKF
jgi:hypothetical protein